MKLFYILFLFSIFSIQTRAQHFYKKIKLITRSNNGSNIENTSNAIQLKNGNYAISHYTLRSQYAALGSGGSWIPVDLYTNGVVRYDAVGNLLNNYYNQKNAMTPCSSGDEVDEYRPSKILQLIDGSLISASNFYNFNIHNGNAANGYLFGCSLLKTDPTNGNVIRSVIVDFGCDNTRRTTIVNDIKEDGQQNIYITGLTKETGQYQKCFLIKLNKNFSLVWSIVLQVANVHLDSRSISLDELNNRVYIGGSFWDPNKSPDAMVVCAEAKGGSIVFSKQYSGSLDDNLSVLQPAINGGYIFLGTSNSFGFGNNRRDFWLNKIDVDGTLQWSYTYGGDNDDYAVDLLGSSVNRQYVLAGHTANSAYGASDIQLIWVSGNGTLKEGKLYGTANDEHIMSITSTSDNGLLFWGNDDIKTGHLYKTDFNGVITKAVCTSAKNMPVQKTANPLVSNITLTTTFNTAVVRSGAYIAIQSPEQDNTECLYASPTMQSVTAATIKEVNDAQTKVVVKYLNQKQPVLEFNKPFQQASYCLYTADGRLLIQKNISNRQLIEKIDMTGKTAGIYFVSVLTDNKKSIHKVMIQ